MYVSVNVFIRAVLEYKLWILVTIHGHQVAEGDSSPRATWSHASSAPSPGRDPRVLTLDILGKPWVSPAEIDDKLVRWAPGIPHVLICYEATKNKSFAFVINLMGKLADRFVLSYPSRILPCRFPEMMLWPSGVRWCQLGSWASLRVSHVCWPSRNCTR